jgi:hypothetical protein
METYRPQDHQNKGQTSYQDMYQDMYQDTYQDAYAQDTYQDNMQNGYEPDYQTGSYYGYQQDPDQVMEKEVVNKSFLFMVVALLITAGAALTTSPAIAIAMLRGNGYILLVVAEIAIVMISNWATSKNHAVLSAIMFAVYSYLTGVLFSVLFLVFTTASIAIVFFVTAGLFAIMAIFGMVTQKDLTTAGSICMMGLIGIILAGVVNLFMQNSALDTLICIIGVLIFVGLTAYDAQKLKNMAAFATGANVLTIALNGAFELYLDFINLFLKLLRLFGRRKD